MKNPVFITTLILITCFTASGQLKDSVKYKNMEPYDFHMTWLRDDKAVLIDVREIFEYRANRIRNAVNIPSAGKLQKAADTIDKNTTLLLYCTTDYRSKRAAQDLADMGFKNVINLEGGIVAWKKDGFPVEKKRVKKKHDQKDTKN
jgi:rhodanese-related sulfurtransferase